MFLSPRGGRSGEDPGPVPPDLFPIHVLSPETKDGSQRDEYSVLVASMLEPAVVYR